MCRGCSLPEDFLGPQTLKVSAHGVKALICGLHIQGAEQVLWAHFVEVKGDTGYVFPCAWLVTVLKSGNNCTLEGIRGNSQIH